MSETASKTAGKPRGRPFAPGNRANPHGRPQGSRNKASLLLDKMLADDGAAVVAAVLEKAKSGDMTAARLVLERLVPPRRERPIEVDLPALTRPGDVVAATAAVTQAVAGGQLTPSEGQALAGLLEAQRRALETAELEVRLARLEAAQEDRL